MLQNKNDTSAAHFSVQTKKLESASRPLKVSQILQGLISSNHLHDWAPTKADMETLLYVTKKHEAKVLVRMKAFKILEELTANKTTAKSISLAGGAKIVIEVMEKNPNHMNTQDLGCTVLAQLATVDDESVEKAGGVNVMRTAVERFPSHVAIQISACKAILAVSKTSYFSVQTWRLKSASEPGMAIHILQELLDSGLHDVGPPPMNDIIPLFCLMEKHATNATVQAKTFEVLSELTANKESTRHIARAGGARSITEAVRKHPDHVNVQELGCSLLANITMLANHLLQDFVDSGLNDCAPPTTKDIRPLLSSMEKYAANATVQAKAFEVLFILTANEESTRNIAREGGAPFIIEAMRNHPDHVDVQELGCALLANITVIARTLVKKAGSIQILLNAMKRFREHASIQISVCKAISASIGTQAEAESIVLMGVVGRVLKAMEAHPNHAEIQEKCCEALAGVSMSNDGVVDIAKRQGIDLLVGALERYPHQASLQAHVCRTIYHLGFLGGQRQMIRNSMADKGGPTLILRTLKLHKDNENVRYFGYKALSVLVNARTLKLKLAALRKRPDNAVMQEEGLFALRAFAECSDHLRDCIVSQEGVDFVMNTMERHEQNPSVQKNGCRLLSIFGQDPRKCSLIVVAGGIECVTNAMEAHENDWEIQMEGFKFLSLTYDTDRRMRSVAAAAA